MKFTALLILAASFLSFSACDRSRSRSDKIAGVATQSKDIPPPTLRETESTKTVAATKVAANQLAGNDMVISQPVSLAQADAANTASQAINRKIIRNANLTLEVTSPTEVQPKIVSIAESHQGFVVTSEATQRTAEDKTRPEITINLVVRVPASQFNQVMEEVRAVGTRRIQEKVTGQDVTEEFIDLEARIKNQKALELQFLEIMKRAGKVEDALSVQTELAGVRTEIEKLEGRRRFLENQASLSTINLTLQPPTQIVNATGFWYSVKTAFSDGVDVAAEIILFMIRAIIALAPVLVLVVLPLALLAKLGIRIVRRRKSSLAPAAAGSE
jgi:Domain of unknown function (DUF4349)